VRPIDAAAGIVNACESLPGVVTGGQPSAAQLAALRDAGVKIILDIRDPMEPRSYDEPVVAGATSDAVMERILVALRGRGERPVFFHCGSGNRVGGALIPHFMLDHGLEEDDAVQRAMRVGLRSAEMLKWGLDYAHRHAP
jgi:protein tyrosine phosphatase (PTP) superfamily phosphohydrolase (DUF442 family)